MSFTHPLGRIVVAYDASPSADAALARAVALAEQFAGEVVVAHVSDRWAPTTMPLATKSGREPRDAAPVVRGLDVFRHDLVEHVQQRVASCAAPVSLDFSTNGVVAGILDAVRRWDATVVAVGTRELSGAARIMAGSTADGLLRNAGVPVIVAHEGQPAHPSELRRVVVGIDASEPTEGATLFSVALALERQVRLIFCSVAEVWGVADVDGVYGYDPKPFVHELRATARDALDAALQHANAVDLYADTDIVEARDVVAGLIGAAQRHDADAIVVGTHGRRHLERLFLGSTAAGVVSVSGVPVFVVPARAHILSDLPAAEAVSP